MEERARLVNGKFTIRSNPGNGTVVEVFVPLNVRFLHEAHNDFACRRSRGRYRRACAASWTVREFEIVGVVSDGRALVKAAAELQPDVIITDIAMPLLNGIEAARQIRQQNLKSKIVFLTMHPEPIYAVEALAAGGIGYVLKSSAGAELIAAVS